MSEQLKSVCVFCGARFGKNPSFKEAATNFGQRLAARKWRLVYGAGDVGIMGEIARSTQDAGGTVFGVIPVHLLDREVGKSDIASFVVTENMHERKKVMFMNSDAIVILPGGAGSMDEFFEVLTWAQLGLHAKPIILLNVDGYWDKLLDLLNHMIANEFADASILSFVQVASDPTQTEALLDKAFT
jgi:uncharacterized protein (TIGR00730 family)